MSSIKLIDVYHDLSADKRKSRMNAFEKLGDFLNQEKVLKELNQISLSKNEELNWELIFIRVHKLVFQEVDRLHRENKKLSPKTKEAYENRILEIIEGSVSSGVGLINYNTIISNVLSVFEVKNRQDLFGSTYLRILNRYILNERKFWGEIRNEMWIELKNLCVEQYKISSPGISNITFLEVLAEIIRISSKNSVIIDNFLDLFVFIKNIYVTERCPPQNFQMALLRLTNIFCRQMALEFRYTVCEFTEDVLDFVINFYEPKTVAKNKHIYHFLATAVNVHCPSGSNESSALSYAHDWKKWKRQIKEIFTLCHQEIKEILKDPSKSDVEVIFVNLLVDITYLMFNFGFDQFESLDGGNDAVDMFYSQSGSSNKRKRSYDLSSQCTPVSVKMYSAKAKQIKLDCNLRNILQELTTTNAWFWLIFLEPFLKKYSTVLKHEFQQVVDYLCQIFTNETDEKVIKGTCRCLSVLLTIEKIGDISLGDFDAKSLSESWNKISDTTLRSFQSLAFPEHYLLINSLIDNFKIQDITPFVDLFREELLESDVNNFNILLTICRNYALPDTAETEKFESNAKCRIIRWLGHNSFKYPPKDLCKVLMSLAFKRSEEGSESSILRLDEELVGENENDFYKLVTRHYMLVSFENLKFNGKKFKWKESLSGIKIDVGVKNYLFDWINIRIEKLINELSDDSYEETDEYKIVSDALHFCGLVAYILSYFKYFRLDVDDETGIISKLEKVLLLCSDKSLELMKTTSINLAPFIDFYKCDFHDELNIKFRELRCINVNFLNHLLATFQENFSNVTTDREQNDSADLTFKSGFCDLLDKNQSVLLQNKFSGKEKRTLNIGEALCSFVIVPGSSNSNFFQDDLLLKVMRVLIMADKSEFSNSDFRLHLSLRILYNLTKYSGIGAEALDGAISTLQTVYQAKHYDFEVATIILEILKGMTSLLHRTGTARTRKKFLELINDFDVTVKKKSFGSKVVMKYVDCLSEIAKHDLDGSWAVKEDGQRVSENLIFFLKYSCNEVRLLAAQTIGVLFHASEDVSILRWQKKMIEKLHDVLIKEYNTAGDDSVYKYSKSVMASASLIAWTNVICSNAYWQKRSLLNLNIFVSLKKVPRDQTENIFRVICKELCIQQPQDLISNNFWYLCSKWIREKYELEDFPYYLLGCETSEEFISKYLDVIVPHYLINGQKNIVKATSSKINVPLDVCIEKCLPELMAYVLPRLNENMSSENLQKAQDLKRFIEELLHPKSLDELLNDNLEKIVSFLMKNLYDQKYLQEFCDVAINIEEERNEFSYGKEEIKQIFQDLSPVRDRSILGYIALKTPSAIQKILLVLSEEIWMGITYVDRIISSYKYFAFLELLGNETKDDAFLRRLNHFLIRDVIYTLVYMIRKNDSENLTIMTCRFLKRFSALQLEKFHTIFIEYLPVIISVIVPMVKNSNQDARDLLNFLIRDNFDKLQSMILLLDPLPSEEIFSETNCYWTSNENSGSRSLRDEMKRFLNAGESRNSGCRLEGLKNLHSMLSSRKEELAKMYEDLKKMRGFSEDCHESLIHRLICMLVELTLEKNFDVKTEAAKCLGELGPADLTTLVLKPKTSSYEIENRDNAFKKLLKCTLTILSDLIVNEDYIVKKLAFKSLYALLSTTEGNKLLENEGLPKKNRDCVALFRSSKAESLSLKIDPESFRANVDLPYLWIPSEHEKWIVKLVKAILKALTDSSGLMSTLSELVEVHWQLAETIFPKLIDLLLSLTNINVIYKKTTSFYMNKFFEDHCDSEKEILSTVNQKSVQCLVNVVDYIRVQRNHEGIYKSELDINYLHVAKAAFYCSAYFTSILYAELWYEEMKMENPHLDIDQLCEKYPKDVMAVAKILRECYFKIGIPDGIHGCGNNHLLDSESEIQHYEHLKKWDLSMLHHDIQLSQNRNLSENGLFNSLQKSGMFYTLNSLIRSSKNKEEFIGYEYKCASRLGDWSLVDLKKDQIDFEKLQYFALKAFHDDDFTSFQSKICKARECCLSELSVCSLECSKNVYGPMAMLQSLKESEDFARTVQKNDVLEIELLYRKWCLQDSIEQPEFKLVESILNQRCIILKAELEKNKSVDVHNYLKSILCEMYFKTIQIARRAKRYDIALRNLSHLNYLEGVPEKIAAEMNMERARISWEKGEKEVGKFFLSHYLKRMEIRGDLKAKGLRLYGDWMASTRSENAEHIIENYYLRAIDEAREKKNKVNAYASLAKFADYNYEQLHEYLSSPLFEIKQDLITRQQDLASGLEGQHADDDERRAAYLAKRQSAIDETEIRNAKREKDEFLNLAVKFYLLVLKEGEKFDLLIFRVVSLWLSNSSDQDVTRKLKDMLGSIPTYKFLCVLPQIVPRMAEIDTIAILIRRILVDHPYHTLPLLFALEKSYEDMIYTNKDQQKLVNPRVLFARKMLVQFQKSDEKLMGTIAEMNRFCSVVIELAHYTMPKSTCARNVEDPIMIPSELKISQKLKMDRVMVPTLSLPYRKNCDYQDVVKIASFGNFFYNVGGVTAPKKIECLGTDGLKRALLIKGKDDLRQDAVMQQVFTIMNSLLSQNSETSKRKLIIRTYKVVPLSQRSGIIEWCDNTQPIGVYLVGKDAVSGAHRKFNPDDITGSECRMRLRTLAERKATNREKLNVFLDICEKFRPAFHNYFTENFSTAEVWFERRLAYTLSVAASSMIGYILGIGDRHVCNILIDNLTAEVIHIDLGIAFEQGKSLPTPEAVPFRLSRDIVDGMGLSGVEGVFRSACVKTMQVLRNNQDTILTLLEVLLYDPLYAWTITPEKAMSKQSDSNVSTCSVSEKSSPDVEVNKMAERALIRLKQKLQGAEGGVPTNIAGQVNYLIQQARDPNNLSKMFHGWQAYL